MCEDYKTYLTARPWISSIQYCSLRWSQSTFSDKHDSQDLKRQHYDQDNENSGEEKMIFHSWQQHLLWSQSQ